MSVTIVTVNTKIYLITKIFSTLCRSYIHISLVQSPFVGLGSSDGIVNRFRAEGQRQGTATATRQAGPGAHMASYSMGSGDFLRR